MGEEMMQSRRETPRGITGVIGGGRGVLPHNPRRLNP